MLQVKIKTQAVALACALFSAASASAHDNNTIHPLLTERAYFSWTEKEQVLNALGIEENTALTFIRLPNNQYPADPLARTPALWLRQGSIEEDLDPDLRCLAHFYNPLPQAQSNNHSLTDPTTLGAPDSFTWASTGTSFLFFTKPVNENNESWKKAREYLFSGLTASTKAEREAKLAHAFYAVGKVMHLLQDLSQPDHSRNDAHMINGGETPGPDIGIYPSARWIENYGRDNINLISTWTELDNASQLNWRLAQFTKLRDFWDRGIYQGSGTKLDEEATQDPTKTLGLAEFINGNFLGEDASYAELIDSDNPHQHFPHPTIADTNFSTLGISGFPVLASTWRSGANSEPGGVIRSSIFLAKERSGIHTPRHSILNYTSWKGIKMGLNIAPSVTINAPSVLEELHKLTLPKAVSYSAGLLDYFFRGQLEITSSSNSLGNQRLVITNRSGHTILGGGWTLHTDDINQVRSLGPRIHVTLQDGASWEANSQLAHEEAVTASFTIPSSTPSHARLIYKGTIGVDPTTNVAYDPIDAGVAIATIPIKILPSIPSPLTEWDSQSMSLGKSGFGELPGMFPSVTYSNPPKVFKKIIRSGNTREERSESYGHWCGWEGEGEISQNGTCLSNTQRFYQDGAFFPAPQPPPRWKNFDDCKAAPAADSECIYINGVYTAGGDASSSGLGSLISGSRAPDENGIIRNIGTISATSTRREWSGAGEYRFFGSSRVFGNLAIEVFDEYTTALLKFNATTAPFAFDNDWNDTPGSLADLTPNELIYSVRASRYRFRVKPAHFTPDTTYTINWLERFIPQNGVSIASIDILSPGTYCPSVTISAPPTGGKRATAIVKMNPSGGVSSIFVSDPGRGYTSPPSVTVQSANGGGASATNWISSINDTGEVLIIYGGSSGNYLPTLAISSPSGTGIPATASCTLDQHGGIAAINLTNSGSGYVTTPTLSIAAKNTGATVAKLALHLGTETPKNKTWDGITLGRKWVARTVDQIGHPISSIQVVHGGSYLPLVTISGDGHGATAVVTGMSGDGKVTGLALTSGGSGYTYAYASLPRRNGGGGSWATATATVSGGTVTDVHLDTQGNYLPTLSITGGGGSGATGTVTLAATGAISSINLTNPGAGYKTNPTLTLSYYGTETILLAAHFGTEIEYADNTQPVGTLPLGYVDGAPRTYPLLGETGDAPWTYFELPIPSTNGTTTVENVVSTYTSASIP